MGEKNGRKRARDSTAHTSESKNAVRPQALISERNRGAGGPLLAMGNTGCEVRSRLGDGGDEGTESG